MAASSDAWIAAPRPNPASPIFSRLLQDAQHPQGSPPLLEGRYQRLRREPGVGPIERWVAQQLRPGGVKKLVRLKHLPAGAPEAEVWTAALLDEAKALSAVDHPNVVQLLDVLDGEAGLTLVREYVDGVSLGSVLSVCQGAGLGLPMDLAVYLASEILWVIDAVHAATDAVGRRLGLVHRGVHPTQIQVTRNGHVKLDGFDLVRMTSGRRAATEPGLVKGFAAYLPPECIAGEVATQAADVYAVGVMLFELLTGESCFSGHSAADVLWQVVQQGPPLERLERHRVPPEVREIVGAATQASPEARYESAAEMARQLDAYGELIRRHGRPWQVAGVFAAQGLYPPSVAERFGEGETTLVARDVPSVRVSARISSSLGDADNTEVTQRPMPSPLQVVRTVPVDDLQLEPEILDDDDVVLITPVD